jgi:hypothetical protein
MNATPQQKNLIRNNIPLHEIIHGEVLLEIINQGKKLAEATGEEEVVGGYEYHRGYADAMQKVYALVYALQFAKDDYLKERKL